MRGLFTLACAIFAAPLLIAGIWWLIIAALALTVFGEFCEWLATVPWKEVGICVLGVIGMGTFVAFACRWPKGATQVMSLILSVFMIARMFGHHN